MQTVDFFTPVVDDPFDFGRIAAANALSDVYAMGGTPLTALQLVSWPRDDLPFELLGQVVDGGASVIAAAGCALIGGHSIDDKEPKYGFAITGTVHPDRIVTTGGGRPGDALILTKPIGTGILSTAIKRGEASEAETAAVVASMVELNRAAAEAMVAVGVNACTDVTGFGLLGHLLDMTAFDATIEPDATIGAEIEFAAVPIFAGVRQHVLEGRVPGGTRRNLAAVASRVDFAGLDDSDQLILADAQTNGGLLMAVDPSHETRLLEELENRGARRLSGRAAH